MRLGDRWLSVVHPDDRPGAEDAWAHAVRTGLAYEQLETVLINLATNARDAMPRGGTLRLSARTEGGRMLIEAADTGAGMAPDVLARAREPFFTTKPPGVGTGLGLALARGFAEQSGGALRIRSAPGKGTVVTLVLPLASPGAAPAGATKAVATQEG